MAEGIESHVGFKKKECTDWSDIKLVDFPSGDPLTELEESRALLRLAIELGLKS